MAITEFEQQILALSLQFSKVTNLHSWSSSVQARFKDLIQLFPDFLVAQL